MVEARQSLPMHIRLVVYSYIDSKKIAWVISKLSKKEHKQLVEGSGSYIVQEGRVAVFDSRDLFKKSIYCILHENRH